MTHYFFVGTIKQGVLQFNKEDELIRYNIENGRIIRKEIIYDNGSARDIKIDKTDSLEDFLKYVERNNINLY
ncbi:MAG: hypothetical protein JW791_00665 [Nanoarchaeota archaeon]|nr:hypothetical protein [Nanoarchaeota archaeon]